MNKKTLKISLLAGAAVLCLVLVVPGICFLTPPKYR